MHPIHGTDQAEQAGAGHAPCAVVHIDLDGAREIHAAHGWPYSWRDDPIFESGLRNALESLDRHGVRATLFAIADRLGDAAGRALLEEAVRRGHEIASHTCSHPNLLRLEHAAKQDEIRRSRDLLESALATAVTGFRAPGYSIDREGLDILADNGYGWDSSAFPTDACAARLGVPVASLRAPARLLDGSPLLELPLPDYRPWPVPFSPSYALQLGNWYFRQGLGRAARHASPFVLLFHLIDFAEPLPADRLRGAKSRIFTLSNRSAERKVERCGRMIDAVRTHYRIITTRQLVDSDPQPRMA